MTRFVFLLLSLLLSCCDQAFSQQQGVEWLTTGQGLSQGFVSCILQDQEGFIWAGTKNGLNRYDGYHFEVFTHDPFDDHSLSADFVHSIVEHGDFLVIYIANSGINLFHKKTRQVYRIPVERILPDYAAERTTAYATFSDASGCLWTLLTVPGPAGITRFFKITLPTGFWENPASFPDLEHQVKVEPQPDNLVCTPVISNDLKTIYTVTETDEMIQIETQTGRRTRLFHAPQSSGFRQLNISPSGNIWYSQRSINGQFQLFHFRPEDSQPTPHEVPIGFLNVLCVDDQNIWLRDGSSLSVFQLGPTDHFDPSHPEIPAIPITLGQYCGILDRSGLSWIGTNGLGIMKINTRSRHFRHLFPGRSIYTSIFQDKQGQIITSDNGNQYLFWSGQANVPRPPIWEAVQSLHREPRILQDNAGVYWVVGVYPDTRNLVLLKVEPNGQIAKFTVPPTIFHYDKFAATLDEQGHAWIAVDRLLIHFNPASGQFEWYDYGEPLKDANAATALAKTADGCWWIGTENGLVQAKPGANGFEFSLLKSDPKRRNSLRNNTIASLLTDPNEPMILWIGTKGGGLNRMDARSAEFTHLTIREGMPDNVIYSVLADEDHRLWMSSNKGLICYNPANGDIKNYTKEDGLQDNEFNTWAYGKGADGTLLFGGINGLTFFQPRQLLRDTLPPNTKITKLRINNRDIQLTDDSGILKQSIEFTSEITLSYAYNSVSLDFVALNFTSPDKNRFRYYLEGAESEWQHEGSDHSASYLNLSPGTYVFKVKGANSEGVWSHQPAILKITVLPPWYRSWAAWIMYVLLVGGGVYAFYRYQLRTKLEHAENQRLKELDNFKSRFFTNITHEFRTPLTVILGMTDQVKRYFSAGAETEHSRSVELIRRNGQNLLNLINQILDLAKLESGKLQLNLEKTDMITTAKYIVESFHSYAAGRKIQLHFLAETEALEMDMDREKVQMVLSNLLSNAIKFTPENGNVYIHVGPGETKGRPACQVKVRDTGIGIPEDKIGQVFDRFYQVDSSATRPAEGTGIGLTLTRELVLLMGGQITVSSKKSIGTTFVVTLPVSTRSRVAEGPAPAMPVPTPGTATPAQVVVSENTEKPLLLLVEDNEDVREYLIECISGEYQIVTANDGQAGIDTALEIIPDLIVSDVMMPEKDGFQLCDTLKNDERSSHIPLVLLTAKADVASRIEGLTRGADDYIAKPFNPTELSIRLRNLVENRRRLLDRYARLPLPPVSEDPDLKMEDAFLSRIRDVVEANLSDSDFEMPHLERALRMSRSQIFRKVKALTGQSPSLFIRSIRLYKAKELLQTTKLSVSEIAYEVGFTTPSYFSTAFLEEFGKNPSDFR